MSALCLVTAVAGLPGDCCSSTHFRYKDKGDDALIRWRILRRYIVRERRRLLLLICIFYFFQSATVG